LFDVCYYIVYVFGSHRNPDIVGRYPCGELLFIVKLLMGCACRVYHEGLAVTDICEMAGEGDGVNKPYTGIFPAPYSKSDDCPASLCKVLFGEGMIWVGFEAGVVNPGDLGLLFEPLRQGQGVFAVPWHTQVQGFEALDE